MKPLHAHHRILVLACACGCVSAAHGQPPPPVKPNPQAPTIAMPAPYGMQRGTTLELTLTGGNLAGPTQLQTSFPAKIDFPQDNNNRKDNGRLRVRLTVPKDAPVGFHTLRLATTRGLSNLRLFCIDDLPQVLQVATNNAAAAAQPLTVPCVVVGHARPETRDFYKVTAKPGQRLSFDVLGRRMGGVIDPVLTLLDARTGRELPDGYCDDAPGLHNDPRLTYTFKSAGTYLVEVHDTLWRGGDGYAYRLRVGDFPCATTPIPLAVKRGGKTKVQFAGPTLDGVAPVDMTAPSDPAARAIWVTPRGANGLSGWPVVLGLSELEERVEQEPNNTPAQANSIPVPGAVTGRFEQKGDLDHYRLPLKKGRRYIIQAHTHDYSSPAEVDMVLKNAAGAQVAEANPQAPPPTDQRIDFTAPADGDYVLAVNSLTGQAGPSEVYRITVVPHEPDFSVSLPIDRYDIAQAGTAQVTVQVARADYGGPVELSVTGPPGITGQGVVAAGQPAGNLVLHARRDLPMGAYPLTIQGKATVNGKPVLRYAGVGAVVSQELGNLPYPPLTLVHQIGIGVTEKAPFALLARFDRPEALRGGPVPLTITATRVAGFTEEIALSAAGLPPNAAPALKNIAKGQKDVKGQLNAAVNAPLGRFPITVVGKVNYHGQEFHVAAEPAALVLVPPFELQVPPSPSVAPGGTLKLSVKAVRKGGYEGPVVLEVRNLPAGIKAEKVTLPPKKSAIDIELKCPPNQPLGKKADVNVLGTATAVGNQQQASANFTLSVIPAKKGKK
jgi:hypothetical protein